MKKSSAITVHQAKQVLELGFGEFKGNGYFYVEGKYPNRQYFFVPTCDEVIDWLRIKYNIIIYNAVEPVVDPKDSHKILFRFAIKWCNKRDGWNGRVYIGTTRFASNIYSLKREAITKALCWLKKKTNETKKTKPTKSTKKQCG